MNKPKSKGLLLFIGFLFSRDGIPQQSPAAVVYREQRSTVVQVIAKVDGQTSISGSGVVINGNGLILTCYHIIESSRSIQVKMADGQIHEEVKVISYNKDRDLALIDVQADSQLYAPMVESLRVVEGQDVYAIGHPQGFPNSISSGIISGIRVLDDGSKWIQITNPISPGSSGGPIFDRNGQVVGITVGSWEAGQNLNFAVDVDWAISQVRSLGFKEISKRNSLTWMPKREYEHKSQFGQAMTLLENNRPKEAVAVLSQLISSAPESIKGYFGMGLAHYVLGEEIRAAEYYDIAVHKTAKDDLDYIVLAKIFLIQEDYGIAVEACHKAIAINPRDSEPFVLKGLALASLEREPEAYKSFRDSNKIRENALAYFMCGILDFHYREDYERARRSFKQSLRLEPSDQKIHYFLGLCYYKLGFIEGFQRELEYLIQHNIGLARQMQGACGENRDAEHLN